MDIRLHRRNFLTLAGAATLGGLGLAGHTNHAKAAEDLVWLTWENLAKDDYIGPFLSQSGIGLTKNFIGTDDEQFAKLRAGGSSSPAHSTSVQGTDRGRPVHLRRDRRRRRDVDKRSVPAGG